MKKEEKVKGYRLHFEGDEAEATAFTTMKEVRAEIRAQAKATGRTIKEVTELAYIVTEEEWREERRMEEEA